MNTSLSPLVLDTGATGHFLTPDHAAPHATKPTPPIHVKLPNEKVISSTHQTTIPLTGTDHLPRSARQAHIFPHLGTSLISVGQLCDHDCTATFKKHSATVEHNNNVIIRGTRTSNGLWLCTPSPNPTDPQALLTEQYAPRLRTHIAFLHAACFSPVASTWIDAIKNNHFVTWPALNPDNVRKYLPKSIATAKGHQDQTRQNTRSTKTQKTHELYTTVTDLKLDTGQVYSDLTGRFPVPSSSGNKYVLILYDYDSNAILCALLKTRTAADIVRAHNELFDRLQQAGATPKLHRLDNEACKELKHLLQHEHKVKFQLAPPNMHRRNAAERAIRTFKNHFIAGLSTTNPDFPLHLWDKLIPQAELTLNLLRTSRLHPQLSAHTHLMGQFDFNATPLAPPGTRVLLHEKPNQRSSWAPHGVDGWYIGPALHHYRCFTVFVPATGATRVVDTVEFFPSKVAMPNTSSTDIIKRAATDTSTWATSPTHNQMAQSSHLRGLSRSWCRPPPKLKQLVYIAT